MAAPTHHGIHADPLMERAEEAAAAALRELPEALIIVFDARLRFVLSAGQVLQRVGPDAAWRAGEPLAGAFPGDLWASMGPLFASAIDGETRTREIWTAGQRHCLMVDVGPLPADAGGELDGDAAGVAVVLDITARRRADALASRPLEGVEDTLERSPIGTGLLDTDGRWLLVNRPLCDITGYTAEELLGTPLDGIVHPEDTDNDLAERARLLAGDIPAFQTEKRYLDAAGETVTAILSMSLVRDSAGAPLHYVAQLQDVSERMQLEQNLRRLADHDALTGLRNSRLFENDLMLQVARSQRYGETAGLLLIDLDSFGRLGERHGELAGDELLKALARGLTRRLRQTDLVARVGVDEFAVLLPHIDVEGMTVVADGLQRVIPACTIDTGSAVVHPSASIGSVLIDRRTTSAQQAFQAAYRAMRIGAHPSRFHSG